MLSVTLLARYVRCSVSAIRFDHLWMEFVLDGRVLVAGKAAERLYLFFVREVVQVEPRVTRNADQLAVR